MSLEINTRLLKSARSIRKLSRAEVARFANISESRLEQFEQGKSVPSFQQLERLGTLYNVPSYVLSTASQFELEATLPDFRKQNIGAANLSPTGLVRIWNSEKEAMFVADVIAALGRDAPTLSGLDRYSNKAEFNASNLRAVFDDWLHKTKRHIGLTGTRDIVFFRGLRYFLDSRGCINQENFAPIKDYLGFYQKKNETSRSLFINKNIRNVKRKLFTLCHELAHYVNDKEGVSNPFQMFQNDIERESNYFAAEFLAPEHVVVDLIRKDSSFNTRDPEKLINALSKESLLSRQASAIRLNELGYISKSALSEYFRKIGGLKRLTEFSEPRAEIHGIRRSAFVGMHISKVGLYPSYVSALAFERKLIDATDIARGLGIGSDWQSEVFEMAKRRFEASIG